MPVAGADELEAAAVLFSFGARITDVFNQHQWTDEAIFYHAF